MINPTSPGSSSRTVCFSFAAYSRNVIEHLRRCHVPIGKGLSEEEFHRIQATCSFVFPPDLRSILQEGLPLGLGFPDWRSSSPKQLARLLSLPVDGLCNEIAEGKFWWQQWGLRPCDTRHALRIAHQALQRAPILVPIYSHCYIPCSPNLAGNPIFFIYEKDVYYCGYDLADFFEREVFVPLHSPWASNDSCSGFSHSGMPNQKVFQKMMSSINEDMVMEAKSRDCLSSAPCPPLTTNHDRWRHHRAQKVSGLEVLNQRLLSELHSWDAQLDNRLYENDVGSSWREDQETLSGEIRSRKSLSEVPHQPPERPPESLVRSAGNSPRLSQKLVMMSRYMYFRDHPPLPDNVLTEFTIAAPPWAAKTARPIPFWSDLVEGKENCGGEVPSEQTEEVANDRTVNPLWLDVYFKDVKGRLRKGGWKQDDIKEMIDAAMPDHEWLVAKPNGKEMLDALISNTDVMSATLREAGWSLQDVLETVGYSQQPSKLSCKTMTGGLVREGNTSHARINKRLGGKLGNFISQV